MAELTAAGAAVSASAWAGAGDGVGDGVGVWASPPKGIPSRAAKSGTSVKRQRLRSDMRAPLRLQFILT